MRKVALVSIPGTETDYDSNVVYWDMVNIPEEYWVDMGDTDIQRLTEYLAACGGYNRDKYKATRNSVFINHKLVICCTPEVIDLSIQKAKELALEYEEVRNKEKEKRVKSKVKRAATTLKNKKKKLEKLKAELGEA